MKKVAHLTAASAAALSLSVRATSAYAGDPERPMSEWSVAGLDSVWLSASNNGSVFGFVPYLSYVFKQRDLGIGLDFNLPFAVSDLVDDTVRGGMGNPGIGVHFAIPATRHVTFSIGMMLHLPLASVKDDDWRITDYFGALAYSGNQTALWLFDYFPMTFPIGLELHLARPAWLRFLVEPQLFIPLGTPNGVVIRGNGDTQYLQLNRVELELRSRLGIGGGLDMNWLVIATNNNTIAGADHMQMSLEPFFGYTNEYFFLRFGTLLALDNPLGFGFDKSGLLAPTVFTAHLTVGGRLD